MVDVVSPAKRSEMMSGIRGKDTKPEMIIRKALHKRGFRYRVHYSGLPGKPDLVFPSRKAVIFVHGCFWHGHDCSLFKWPSTNKEFWKRKITENKKRDRKALSSLPKHGWRTLVIWECSLKGRARPDFDQTMKKLIEWLDSQEKFLEIGEDYIA